MARKPVFTVAGIPVHVQPVFFFVIIFIGLAYLSQPVYLATWVVIATASILLHEFGHAFAFRGFGLRPSVTLHGMGGVTQAAAGPDDPPFTPVRSIITSAAGPLAALALVGLPALWYAQQKGYDPWLAIHRAEIGSGSRGYARTPGAEIVLSQLIYINIGWSLLNLIPVLPLDGGNITASACELVTPRNGRRIANVLSIPISIALALWGWNNGYVVAPVFALMFIGINVVDLARSKDDTADKELVESVRSLIAYDPTAAEQLARSVLARRPTGERLRWATELTAWCRLAVGDLAGARHVIVTMPPSGGPSATIRGALALAAGQVHEGVSTIAWAMVHDDRKGAKVLGAMAAAQSGQAEAVAHELVRMGPAGLHGAEVFAGLLDFAGHRADAVAVNRVVTFAAPHPPVR